MTCATPGDSSFNSVVLLCHFDGTNGQTTFTDKSNSAHALTATGATVTTTSPKFGTGAGAFGGFGSQRIAVTGLTDFQFGSGQFTIEGWGFVPTFAGSGVTAIMAQFGGSSNLGWFFGWSGTTLTFFYSTTGSDNPSVGAVFSPTTNTWIHYAVDRDVSNVLRVYAGGVVKASATVSNTFFSSTQTVQIGNDNNATRSFIGNLDDVRVTKGVARYAGAFTPPTAAFPDGLPCPPGGGLMFRGVGSLAFPSPGLVAALGGARAILRNKPTTRRGLLRPWQ